MSASDSSVREELRSVAQCLQWVESPLLHAGETSLSASEKHTFSSRTDNELDNMVEADILQEIANTLSVLLLCLLKPYGTQSKDGIDALGDFDSISGQEEVVSLRQQFAVARSALVALHIDSGISPPDDKVCICGFSIHFPDRPMVECVDCKEWYHVTCIGLGSSTEALESVEFSCPCCSGKVAVAQVVRMLSECILAKQEKEFSEGIFKAEHDIKTMDIAGLVSQMELAHQKLLIVSSQILEKPLKDNLNPLKISWNGLKLKVRIPKVFLNLPISGVKRKAPYESLTAQAIVPSSAPTCVECTDVGGLLLSCDKCHAMCHPKCLDPPVVDFRSLPNTWECTSCSAKNF